MSDPSQLARLNALIMAQKKAGLRPEIPSTLDPEPWLNPETAAYAQAPAPNLGREHNVYRAAMLNAMPEGARWKILSGEPAGELLDPPASDSAPWMEEIRRRRMLNSMKKGGQPPTPPQEFPPGLMLKLLGGSLPARPQPKGGQPFKAGPGVVGPVLK